MSITPKPIGLLTKVFYIYGPNLVILASTGYELSSGQARDWRTDGRTHRQTQAMTISQGQNWPWVKNGNPFIKNLVIYIPVSSQFHRFVWHVITSVLPSINCTIFRSFEPTGELSKLCLSFHIRLWVSPIYWLNDKWISNQTLFLTIDYMVLKEILII